MSYHICEESYEATCIHIRTTLVSGLDRKLPLGYRLASRGLPNDDRRDGCFYLTLTLMIGSAVPQWLIA